MSEPKNVSGEYNSIPLQLIAGQVTNVTVRTAGSIELVNLDRRGRFWVRMDGKPAEVMKSNNFVVHMSRRYSTNKGVVRISLIAEQDVWVIAEGTPF